MPGERWIRPPEEWQNLINKCLSLKFDIGEFVPIPDRVRGDCGLEGFTRGGLGFQCYAAEEPLITSELTRKQKAKITSDLGKLVKYKTNLARLLGPTMLDKWILVVPRWEDKALLAHAEEKMKLLRVERPSFISPNIVPSICTGRTFRRKANTRSSGSEHLRVDVPLVDQAKITDWVATNDELVAKLDEKTLAICYQDSDNARQLRNESVRNYLNGQNALEKLREDFPEIFEAVDRIKKDKEYFLVMESLTTASLPAAHLRETLDSLENDLARAFSGLDRFTVRQFVHGAVADWLLRCPLHFPKSPL
ncbi:MAG: hypothetical protein IPP94_07725 [Ignavibacteria bacterium]|nr:hypothetical protein [Ignavibacteria bacterium]